MRLSALNDSSLPCEKRSVSWVRIRIVLVRTEKGKVSVWRKVRRSRQWSVRALTWVHPIWQAENGKFHIPPNYVVEP